MENNILEVEIRRINNIVIVIPKNIPDWAKKDNFEMYSHTYALRTYSSIDAPQINAYSCILPKTPYNTKLIASHTFFTEEDAETWVAQMLAIIKRANYLYTKEDVNTNEYYRFERVN